MESNFHHGERLRLLSIQKDKSETEIAAIRGVTKQAINNDFNRETIGLKTIKTYCNALGITLEDFYPKKQSETSLRLNDSTDLMEDNNNYMYKYLNLLETTNKLWTIVAQNGIKVDLGKFREVLKQPFENQSFFLGQGFSKFSTDAMPTSV